MEIVKIRGKQMKNAKGKVKKQFKMPHLLWIMMGILLLCSILTYIIPAGQFAMAEDGKLLGDQFQFLGYQTPVNPLQAILQIMPGLQGSAAVIFVVMVSGASIEVFLETKCFDRFLDFSLYKMQGKGDILLISVMFFLMGYLGAFGGSDALIAIIPIGILFANKLKLDPIVGLGLSLFATQIGFGTGPTKQFVTQGLMGTKIYGGFFSRFLIMNIFLVVGLIMLLSYVKRIRKNPEKSIMYASGWRPEIAKDVQEDTKTTTLSWKDVVNLVLFFGQFVAITIYGLVGDSSQLFAVMASLMLVVAIVQGLLAGMSADDIGNTFSKGLANMAFVGFIIGLARSVSLVLTAGNVLHTIVYVVTLPLLALPRWISSVGMTLVIALINPIIPSATSKAAILVPIIKPIGEVLQLHPEMIVQAFQFGDGFSNIVSPLLGWTIGGIAMANVSYPQWLKWALPKVLTLVVIACMMIFLLTTVGWTFII